MTNKKFAHELQKSDWNVVLKCLRHRCTLHTNICIVKKLLWVIILDYFEYHFPISTWLPPCQQGFFLPISKNHVSYHNQGFLFFSSHAVYVRIHLTRKSRRRQEGSLKHRKSLGCCWRKTKLQTITIIIM